MSWRSGAQKKFEVKDARNPSRDGHPHRLRRRPFRPSLSANLFVGEIAYQEINAPDRPRPASHMRLSQDRARRLKASSSAAPACGRRASRRAGGAAQTRRAGEALALAPLSRASARSRRVMMNRSRLAFGFRFRRLDQHRAMHDQREIDRHRVIALVDHRLGEVERGDAGVLQQAVVEQRLVHAGPDRRTARSSDP